MGDPRPLDPSVCKRADLLDFGAGNGRRIRAEAKQFASQHPIGIDRNARKVARAQERGLPVYCADFTELDPRAFPTARVVVFDNVLEHLPSPADVEIAFGRACEIASNVVYIRHPSFEDEDYLASLGVKQYWTDWPGVHTAKVRLDGFMLIAGARPVPETSTFCGLPVALSVTVMFAERAPLTVGVNVTLIVQLPPAATAPERHVVELIAKSAAFAPVSDRPLTDSGAVPVLDTVTVRAAAVV